MKDTQAGLSLYQIDIPLFCHAQANLSDHKAWSLVGRICYNFEKNRAFYDKSMKLGTWLDDNNTNKLRVSATPKMSSNGRHLVFFQNGRLLKLIHYNVIFNLFSSVNFT